MQFRSLLLDGGKVVIRVSYSLPSLHIIVEKLKNPSFNSGCLQLVCQVEWIVRSRILLFLKFNLTFPTFFTIPSQFKVEIREACLVHNGWISRKFQTTFEPPPPFWGNNVAFFSTKFLKKLLSKAKNFATQIFTTLASLLCLIPFFSLQWTQDWSRPSSSQHWNMQKL